MVIGLEVHVQLLTKTKLFCPCSTAFGAPPNANTCPVCLALPGALPVLNRGAVRLAARAAYALGCTVHEESVFARKNYFYPDLPKGYQISQFDRPLATGGFLALEDGPGARGVRIHRVHMEEDAGKSIHDRYPGHSAIDLNRSGTPLIEIVSEPDLRSAADAGVYLRRLKQILEYTEVSDANMEEGSLRVDANVSVRAAGADALGTKTEIKNMNSFSGVERALEVEFARQVALVERGERVVQQTMLWDAGSGTVRPARSKEESHDYRYFPEPDLPPLRLTSAVLAEWREAVGAQRAEPFQQRERALERSGLRSLEPRKFREVALAPGKQLERGAGEIDAANLGIVLRRERTLFALVPQPQAHPRCGAARAAGTLVRGSARDALEHEAVEADGRIEAHDACEA
ncbi:MAG: Asp-tRNA(Asn)/Glu-tRNA(Gln) amidotransferase subunit GatB [Gemmatimonadaceae bacterium]|nr:Asp-tRNA(Asn)/Glu-tRNA(Gln) amidotransferase subunit GatB [Gemmatimonadaceae bacterium]